MNQRVLYSSRGATRVLISVGLGLAALTTILATFIITQSTQDIRPALIVTYCAFAAAGFCSPGRQSGYNWIGAILVLLGGILPGVALRVSGSAFTDNFYGILIPAAAVVAVLLGVTARYLVSRGHLFFAGAVSTVTFVGALTAVLSVVPRLLDQRAFVEVDRPIAAFSIRSLDGAPISSDSWRGRIVVLSYWATWCPSCLAEIPEIAALQRKYDDDPRVAVVAVNAGYGGDTPQKARQFLERRHFEIATDIDDIRVAGRKQGEAAVSLGLEAVPTLFILNKNQKLVAVHAGFDASEHLATTLSNRIDSLVKGSP